MVEFSNLRFLGSGQRERISGGHRQFWHLIQNYLLWSHYSHRDCGNRGRIAILEEMRSRVGCF